MKQRNSELKAKSFVYALAMLSSVASAKDHIFQRETLIYYRHNLLHEVPLHTKGAKRP
jgi:hypothetical protein